MSDFAVYRPFDPDWASPPGHTLSDLLDVSGISQHALAAALDLSTHEVEQLLSGEAPISCRIASKLEEMFGAPARFWVKREAQYRLARLRGIIDVRSTHTA